MSKRNSTVKPVNPSRRRVVKGAAVAAAAAAVGPWVVSRRALGAGEVNCTIWTDYIPAGVISDFTAATGIRVNYKQLGSNEELINQMKATKGAGVDLCSPTNNRSGGQLEPGDVWGAYRSEAAMRPVWQRITDFCIARKSQIKLFWNDTDAQKNGLLNDGVVVGQTWDGPPLSMKNDGEPIQYQAPKEGAMAWVDSFALSAAAENIDQAYELINYVFDPKVAGKSIDTHGYNSAVLGADAHAGDSYKKNFAEAYPGDALANLNPWPAEPQGYADVRTEYRNKFVNA